MISISKINKSIVNEFFPFIRILVLAFVVVVIASCESVDPNENNKNENDTLNSDTIPKDTIPSDTIPNDTIPNDTIPNDTIADFRDKWIGTYTCIETYTYFDPINDTIMNWTTDTISLRSLVSVEKHQDSTLKVTTGNYFFIGTNVWGNKFECLECNGPPDYALFFPNDSVYIYLKRGVTNNKDYYGKK